MNDGDILKIGDMPEGDLAAGSHRGRYRLFIDPRFVRTLKARQLLISGDTRSLRLHWPYGFPGGGYERYAPLAEAPGRAAPTRR